MGAVDARERGFRREAISAKTFLLVKRDMFKATVAWNQGSQQISETFSDFHSIGGIMIPFQSVSNHPELGRVVAHVKEVKFDESIPDATFRSQKQTQLH